MTGPQRRLGRPPESDGTETRRRILDAARRRFATMGYEAAASKVAADVGLSAAALYHYFDSKRAMYVAVFEDVRDTVTGRFEAATAAHPTFVAKLGALLDATEELNRQDPSLTRFLTVARTEVHRVPELQEALGWWHVYDPFFEELVDQGIAAGEVDPSDRAVVLDVILAVLIGLTAGAAEDNVAHHRAVHGFKRLLLGDLLAPARGPSARRAN